TPSNSADSPLFQYLVEHARERVRAFFVDAGKAIVLLLQQVVFVGDVEGCENGYAQRIGGRGLLGYRSHFQIDIIGELLNVVGIGPAQIVGLVVDIDADASGRNRCLGGLGLRHYEASERASICLSIFSTRPRTSSRSRRRVTICWRIVSTSSSRSSSCSRRRLTSRSAIFFASRAAFNSSMVL